MVEAQGDRLIGLNDMPASRVTEVDTAHGTLAVGLIGDVPFAVSNVCRHQFAKLGQVQVRDGCLDRLRRYDVEVREGYLAAVVKGRVRR